MAYMKAWTSKEEVLNDLARASGKRPRKRDDLDDGYLVIGDAPPPVIPEDTDAEMEILFGGALSGKSMPPAEEDNTPDLAGIQQMIRMMQDFNSGDDNNNDAGDADIIAITKVSKLNPNVQEFRPRRRPIQNSRNNFSSPSKSNISRDINSSVVTQTGDALNEQSKKEAKEVKGKESGDDNDINLDENIGGNKQYEDIATTLKNQISDAAKSDSYEYKKQKNVAIATLLRLYTKNNAEPKKNEPPIKLITPEYFEGKMENQPDVKVEDVFDVGSTATSSTPEPKDSSTTLPSCSTFSTSSSSTPSKKSPKVDPEIKRSIEKVNRWLGEPTKPSSSAICLGPIAFKRKEPANCKSPASDSNPKANKPIVDTCQKYQPSKFAADLGKKYLERNKAIEKAEKEVNWANLEKVLKQKDLEIAKKRSEEQTSPSS